MITDLSGTRLVDPEGRGRGRTLDCRSGVRRNSFIHALRVGNAGQGLERKALTADTYDVPRLLHETMLSLAVSQSKVPMSVNSSEITGSWTPDAAMDSDRLVRAIQEGDSEAEHAFVGRYMRPVKAMLLARSRNPDLAADLLQDVMMDAISALRRGQLREPAKLSSFVVGIARNRLNNHYRSSVRQPESLEFPDMLPDLSSNSENLESQERENLAMNAISSLDPIDKTILQMTLVDGLKPGIIAQRLSLNPDVVRQRKLRATRRVIEFVRRQSQSENSHHHVVGKVT